MTNRDEGRMLVVRAIIASVSLSYSLSDMTAIQLTNLTVPARAEVRIHHRISFKLGALVTISCWFKELLLAFGITFLSKYGLKLLV